MNKFLVGFLVTLGGGATALTIVAARYQPTIRQNVFVGPISVGGLSQEEAAKKLRVWWQMQRIEPIALAMPGHKDALLKMSASQLGVELDDRKSVEPLPMTDLVGDVAEKVRGDFPARADFKPVFAQGKGEVSKLVAKVQKEIGPAKPAHIAFEGGQIVREPETSTVELDTTKVFALAVEAVSNPQTIELPLKEAPKHVPDSELAKVTDVISQFTTRFSAGQVSRCENIRLASKTINGTILMPGERFSFNQRVGQRTIDRGFKVAGVYKNGKHDVGIGGGICQVSTTLYNAAVFADLKIPVRSNHSLPVPYVPLGRDATVDYGNRDLVIENSTQAPIALLSTYQPGALTFRILGAKQDGLAVKVLQGPIKTWDRGIKYVKDPTLVAGKQVISDKGGLGHTVTTFKCIYNNGKLERKERLAYSYYAGAPKIINVGTKAAKGRPVTAPNHPLSITPASNGTVQP